MVFTSRHHFAAMMCVVLSLTSCSDTDYVMRPPAPEKLSPGQTLPPQMMKSIINVPVQLNLSEFLHAANDPTVIPKTFDHWGSFVKHPKGGEYRYYAERDDFAIESSNSSQVGGVERGGSGQDLSLRNWWKGVELSGSSLSVRAPLRYKIGLRPHAVGDATTQCGDGTEWPRRAALTGDIALGMTPSYGVAASLRGVTVDPIDFCQVRVGETDMSQAVNAKLSDHVKIGLTKAVSRLNTLTVKSYADEVWNALGPPIQLEQGAWLLLNIEKVRHAGFSKDDHRANNTLEITAHPVIVRGTEPPATPVALPQLDTEPSSADFQGVADVQGSYSEKQPLAERFHVLADVQVDYPTLSKTLSNRLKGKRVANKGNYIRMTGAEISGLGDNQVLLRVDFNGDARGHVYLIGKPEINGLTQTVYLGGLRYDTATTQMLQTTAPDWLYHAPLRESITPEIVLGMTPMVDQLRDLLKIGLNRTLTPTVSIKGVVASMRSVAVFADADALRVRAMSDGALTVTAGSNP